MLADLDDLLNQELSTLRLFSAAIADEQAILVSGEIDPLPAATARKSSLAAQLSQLDAQRNQLLLAKGYLSGAEGMAAWRQALETTSEALACWDAILDLAAKSKAENDINGRLISGQLQKSQQALSILMGDAGKSITYGANGQTTGQNLGSLGRRPLGHA